MNSLLVLRTLLLLAFVAAATAVLVQPGLAGSTDTTAGAMPMLVRT